MANQLGKAQPIETRYKGCRFRSRLEARTAVLFDTLGLEWVYEPEGFVLSDGSRYLPDFYSPTGDVWVEVKPTTPTEREKQKCSLLSQDTGCVVILRAGQIGELQAFFFYPDGSCEEYSKDTLEQVSQTSLWPAIQAARSARFEFGESGGQALGNGRR